MAKINFVNIRQQRHIHCPFSSRLHVLLPHVYKLEPITCNKKEFLFKLKERTKENVFNFKATPSFTGENLHVSSTLCHRRIVSRGEPAENCFGRPSDFSRGMAGGNRIVVPVSKEQRC